MEDRASYWKIKYAGFLAVLCFLTPLPALAAFPAQECLSNFRRRVTEFQRRRAVPSAVRETQKIAGLKDEEIKGSVIVAAGSYFSDKFMVYAKREMGAEGVLILDLFKGNIPDHFFMPTHPLFTDGTQWGFMPFQPSVIWQKLGGQFADITLSLSIFGKYSLDQTYFWLKQMMKITKPGGLVILDLGKRNGVEMEKVTQTEFQSVLSEMETSGAISGWSAQHVNHRFAKYQVNPLSLYPSVTYRIVTAKQPSPSDGLRRNLQREEKPQWGLVVPFPHRPPATLQSAEDSSPKGVYDD